MKYFSGITDKKALKKRYRELALQHHPDRGGDVAVMQDINAEFREAMKGGSPRLTPDWVRGFYERGIDPHTAAAMARQAEAMRQQQQAQAEAFARQYQENDLKSYFQRVQGNFNQTSPQDWIKDHKIIPDGWIS